MSEVNNEKFLSVTTELIKINGITKAKLLKDLELNKSSFINWEQRGTIPSGEILSKIANYFNVSIDYLLGNTDNKEKTSESSISDEDIKFALFGGDKDITDEMYEEVKQFVQFVKEKNRKNGNKHNS